MKKLIGYCIFLITVLGTIHSKAQELFPIHLDYQKGLSTNTIYDIAQDSKGFIWMTGNEGLFRYDGFRSTAYKSAQQTSTAGSIIQIDRHGRVWYENFDGFVYYVEHDSLKALPQNAPIGYMPYGITDQYLFVPQKKGIDVYDLQQLSLVKTISIKMDIPEHATTKGSAYYFIADNILYKIGPDLSVSSSNYFAHKNLTIKYIYPFRDRLYVVSKNNEEQLLYFFDEQLNFKNNISIPQIRHIQGSDVEEYQIMIHTPQGVYTYDDKGKLLFSKDGQFKEMSASAVIKDYQNNYWISSINNGVYVIPGLQNHIYPITGYRPTRLEKNPSGYLLGTQEGALLQLNESFKIEKKISQNKESLPVYYIHYNQEDDYTIYSAKGFSYFNNSHFTKETNYNIALKEMVRLDNKYAAYAASGFCALYLNPLVNDSIKSVWDHLYQSNTTNLLPNTARIINGVRAKAVDYNPQTQEIAFATNIGLYLVTPTTNTTLLLNGAPFYANDVIWTQQQLFVLDTKGSLYSIDKAQQFHLLNDELNIPSSDIKRIKKFDDGIVIIGSKYIYTYNPITKHLTQTAFSFGIQNICDIIKIQDHLIILTNNGIVKIAVSDIENNIAPRFFINAIFINNKKSNNWGKLQYNENNIHVDFSLLEYSGNIIPVYYRINKKEWITINNNTRTLDFPALAPGKYTIEFKIGAIVSKETIHFEISTPYWKAWWFYGIISVIGGMLLFSYYKWQTYLMKNQIRLLNEKITLEKNLSKSVLTSIKSQMNPHFFYNALNTIQAYIFTNDRLKANTYLAKFSKLTRLVLEMSEKESISLTEEIESLNIYLELEKMRFTDSFSYTITTPNITDKDNIAFPPMLIQPYVENAVKHGLLHREEEKILHITFEQTEKDLQVTIVDNGIGRKRSEELNKIKNQKHQSFSTKANEKRLEILNKRNHNRMAVNIIDQYDENGNATGTTVMLFIPIH